MMDIDQSTFTYIGMAVVVIIAIYYVYKVLEVQHDVIEGLTMQKNQKPIMNAVSEGKIGELKQSVEKLSDTMLIQKYRNDYEDMVMELEQVIDFNILQGLVSLSSTINKKGTIDYTDSKHGAPRVIPILNELYTLKENLNSTMEFIDSRK